MKAQHKYLIFAFLLLAFFNLGTLVWDNWQSEAATSVESVQKVWLSTQTQKESPSVWKEATCQLSRSLKGDKKDAIERQQLPKAQNLNPQKEAYSDSFESESTISYE
ncbi:hypothetical protein [Hugenholtzia roseola]|uniref:hypothetical protein n=1 Tax=Hugenholtzia roseola TaxID=1002 RepID=UPI00041B0944|nr:hypothetical protein [Hugenholtzia roseola]